MNNAEAGTESTHPRGVKGQGQDVLPAAPASNSGLMLGRRGPGTKKLGAADVLTTHYLERWS